MHDLAMIGLGNMGISVMGAFLSQGQSCIGIDIDADKIEALKQGRLNIDEEGADAIIRKGLQNGKLTLSTDSRQVADARMIYISVQTPAVETECDYSIIQEVLRSLVEVAAPNQAIIIGSTLFPHAIENIILPEFKERPDIEIIYNPVFLRAGTGIEDTLRPGKFILGVRDPDHPPQSVVNFFKEVVEAEPKIVPWREAEWIKVVHNAWMCVKITFANEMDVLCRQHGVDTGSVFDLCFKENEAGRLMTLSHMLPGPPYSGPCLPKDATILQGIVDASHSAQTDSILAALKTSNDQHIETLIQRWLDTGKRSGKPLGLIGMSFRPGFTELRSSLVLPFIRRAQENKLPVMGYDPALENISERDYRPICRHDAELESLHLTVTHSLEQVWNNCGVVLLNRKLSEEERRRVQNMKPGPEWIDLYDNETF